MKLVEEGKIAYNECTTCSMSFFSQKPQPLCWNCKRDADLQTMIKERMSKHG